MARLPRSRDWIESLDGSNLPYESPKRMNNMRIHLQFGRSRAVPPRLADGTNAAFSPATRITPAPADWELGVHQHVHPQVRSAANGRSPQW